MKKHTRRLPVLGMMMAALTLGAAAAWAVEFPEAELFFELNDSDGDLGIHSSIDGPAWKKLTITDPNKHLILSLRPKGRLARQGLTQLFIESAEPSFDELAPEDSSAGSRKELTSSRLGLGRRSVAEHGEAVPRHARPTRQDQR